MWAMALGLFNNPVARYAAIGLAVLAFISYQRHDAASEARIRAEAECREEVAARTEAEVERQTEAYETVLEEARERARNAEAEAEEIRERADDLLDEIRESGDTCRLGDDTLERLRAIH